MEDSIFYHEDLYRQIELMPQENYFKILSVVNDRNLDYDYSSGFVSIKERSEQKIKIEDLSIKFSLVKDKLENFIIKEYNVVQTGYSDTITTKKNTLALGFERIAIFFELSNSGIIKNIWMCQSIYLPKVSISNNLFNALIILGKDYNLILVDWNEEIAVRLSFPKAAKVYLQNTFEFNFVTQ